MGRTGRESTDQGENRYSPIPGVSEERRHGSNQQRIGRPGQNTDIPRFWGCQAGENIGRSSRESPEQGEYRYSTIQGVSGRGRLR